MMGPKVIVLGGTGYVGGYIVKGLAQRGARVVSVSRSGAPVGTVLDNTRDESKNIRSSRSSSSDGDGSKAISQGMEPSWSSNVTYVKGDAMKTETYAEHLEGACALVSAVGVVVPEIGHAARLKERAINASTIHAADACERADIKRIVFISASMPSWMLSGYRLGKLDVEKHLMETFQGQSTILRPGGVSGTRVTSSGIHLRLHLIMDIVSTFMQLPLISHACHGLMSFFPSLLGGVLEPPVKIASVVAAACDGALCERKENDYATNIITNQELLTYKPQLSRISTLKI